MTKGKIIFLDVDGVLNNATWAFKMHEEEGISVYSEDLLEDRALRLLKMLIDTTGAKIVVSSSWRRIPTAYENLVSQLKQYGMEVFDVTPYIGGARGNDIAAWFNRNHGEWEYVILDDDSDMLEYTPHLVQTSFYTGLTRELVDKCIDILEAKDN